jgi:single-strand DNA-binding protein
MRGLNKIMLIGNIGKDPDVRILEGNVKVAKFSVATSEPYKDDKGQVQVHTEWHTVVAWRGVAELVDKYVTKGSLVHIEGKNRTRTYDDKQGVKHFVTEIIVDQLILLDKKTEPA